MISSVVVSGVIESMISKTLSDGITRKFGDYFAVRLEIKGTFDEKDAKFDPKKNSVKVVLVPLKRFRKAVETRRPQNKMKPPRALMTEIRGESSSADQVKFGENIVITGRDLTVVDMSNQVSVSMVCKDGKRKYDCWSIDDMIEHTPTRIVVRLGLGYFILLENAIQLRFEVAWNPSTLSSTTHVVPSLDPSSRQVAGSRSSKSLAVYHL